MSVLDFNDHCMDQWIWDHYMIFPEGRMHGPLQILDEDVTKLMGMGLDMDDAVYSMLRREINDRMDQKYSL